MPRAKTIAKVLPDLDADLFEKQFPDLTDEQLDKFEQQILFLYESSVDDVQRLVERGFTEDFKNINMKEWILFVTNLIPKIEKIKGVVGAEKKELLIGFAIFIIVKSLPIDPATKGVLIMIIKEFLPEIVDGIIFVSKKIHTFGSWLKKKFCC